MSLSFEHFLERIPFAYRKNVRLLGDFKGNRSRVSFLNIGCGCEKEYQLKVLLLRKNFEVCKSCIKKCNRNQKLKYNCNRCEKLFTEKKHYDNHETKCKAKYNSLIKGIDYVVCAICGFHAKSLGIHVKNKHGIDLEKYKKNNKIICDKSSEVYSKQNLINTSEFRKNIRERGPGSDEYLSNMGQAVRESILSNSSERKRRAKVMSDVNRSDVMRKKSSKTAKKTSARKDIQEQRAAQLKRWRDENPAEFYEKCISKMISSWHSKPEKLLFEIVSEVSSYCFKRNQTVKSNNFVNKSKRKQIDITDKQKRVYIEYDGQLHFKQTKFKQLDLVKLKDKLLDNHITQHNWTLIRVSYDQFSYRKSNYGFKKECLDKVFQILDNPTPGVHYIGEAYE